MLRSIVLAAGKGTRLHSAEHDLPKVMHRVCGRPLLDVALELVDFIPKEKTYIVVGYKKEDILSYFGPTYHYVEQKEQFGTGHAVMATEEEFRNYDGNVLVTYGDMPLYRKESLRALAEAHQASGADCTVMSAICEDLPSYGRITRDTNGRFSGIVEAKDCTPEQLKITELNSGVAIFRSKALFRTLPLLRCNNAQNEYYLTDVPAVMMREGYRVELFSIRDGDEIRGVNTPEEQQIVEKILQKRIAFAT